MGGVHLADTAGRLIEYVQEMGIDPEILSLAFATSPDRVTITDEATMRRIGITTDGCRRQIISGQECG